MTDDPDPPPGEVAATALDLAAAVRALLLDGQTEDEVIDIRDAWPRHGRRSERVHQA